jgi:hypothetical protein
MAISAQKPKSAMATLTESFENLVESQRKKLSKEEFKKARASRGRRRETA